MPSVASVAEKLVAIEESRTRSRMTAYNNVASKIGRSGEWLRKIIRERVESVNGEIERRLDALLVQSLEAKIANLTAELEVAAKRPGRIGEDNVAEIEACLARAQSLLSAGEETNA